MSDVPCAKFTVLDTANVMWNPSASRPYMPPMQSPETIASASKAASPSVAGNRAVRARVGRTRDDAVGVAHERAGMADEVGVRLDELDRVPGIAQRGDQRRLEAALELEAHAHV